MRRAAPPSQRIETPEFYTAGELATAWKVSKQWIWSLHKSGKLPGLLLGRDPNKRGSGVLRFAAKDVAEFLARGQGGDGDGGAGGE